MSSPIEPAKMTRWQRFRRIPSLKRLVIFSLFMMLGSLASLVGGIFAIHLFVPGMVGTSRGVPGMGGLNTWLPTPGRTVFQGERKRINLLVVGVDYNHDEKGIIYTKGARTDTMMVASIGDQAQFLNVVSIPRDTYVQISESTGHDKINAAYSYGGIKQSRETASGFLGVPIHYYVIVKVHGAKKIIDALGGLPIDVEKNMDYDDNWGNLHIHLKKGPQILNGEQAVGYARFRNDEEGDRGRIRRQQQVIRAVLRRLKDPSVVTKFQSLAKAVKETLETDLTVEQMIDLAMLYRNFDQSKMRAGQIIGDDDMVGEAMVIVPYEPENSKTVRRLLKDDIDLGMRDVRIRILNGTSESNLGNLIGDEMNLEGFNVVKIDSAESRAVEKTEIIEHTKSPRVRKRLQDLFPDAVFRDSASPNSDFDVTITLGKDRGFLVDHPTPSNSSSWDRPANYPTYRNPEPPRPAPQPQEPDPEPEPVEPDPMVDPEPNYPVHQENPPAEAPAPAPVPVEAPAPAPIPVPVEAPVAPPPAPAPAPAPAPVEPAPVATPLN